MTSTPVVGAVISATATQRASRTRVTQLSGILLLLLVVQNGLGIYVNLFVTLSLPSSIATVFPVVFSNGVLTAHAVIALFLLITAALLVFFTGRSGDLLVRLLAIVGLLVLILTAYLGYHFVATQDNAYSFGMEMGFLALLLVNFVIVGRFATGAGTAPTPPAVPSP